MAEDAKLATALKQAKQTPMFFAFIAVGASDGKLIVGKKKIAVKEINEAKAESGGKKVYQGRCVAEDGKMVFEMAEEAPNGVAKALKSVISASAGLMLQVETRVAPDLQEGGGGSEGTESGVPLAPPLPPQPGTSGQIPEPPPLPQPKPVGKAPPTDPEAARFAARLKALAPIMLKVEAIGGEAAKKAKNHIGDGSKLFAARLYAPANGMLDQAEIWIKKALQAGPVPKAPPQPNREQAENESEGETPQDPAAALYAKQLSELERQVDACLKENRGDTGKMRAVLAFAQEKGEAGQYAAALQSLKMLQGLVQQAGSAPETSPSKGHGIAYRQAMVRWHDAKTQAEINIQELAALALKDFPDEAAALKTLDEALAGLNEGLTDTLDAADSSDDDRERAPFHEQAVALINEYRSFVASNELIDHIDANPWTKPNLKKSLLTVLNDLADQLD